MEGLLIGAVIGAAAGALGYLAARLVQHYRRLHATPYWIVVVSTVVGIVGGTALMDHRLLFGGEVVAVDDVLPYMRLVKEREPQLYERVETSVIRDQEDGMTADQVRNNAKSLVMSYVADRVASLPDDLTYELFATTRDQLAYLLQAGEHTACADLALGRAKGDIDAKLSKELIERANNNAARVISTKPEANARMMSAEEFAQLATRAFADASQASGVPAEDVDNILAGAGDPEKTCKLMKAFFDALLAQPVEVAAAALRTLSSGERRATP